MATQKIMIPLYQKYISPLLHSLSESIFGPNQGCRFYPTCSEYSRLAFKKYNPLKATIISVYRFLRCNPLSKGGADPLL